MRCVAQMPSLQKSALKAALALGVVAAVVASHAASPAVRWGAASLVASYIGTSGYYKQRLSTSGEHLSVHPSCSPSLQCIS